MPRPHRYTDDHTPGGPVFEIMLKCVGGTYLLRPDDELNAIIVGELAHALYVFRGWIRVHEFVCQSNHLHALISGVCQEAIEDFMEYFAGNVAVKIGRLRDWQGRVWNARYSLTQVFPSAQRVRQRYLWAQGLPENLYASPSENPCVSSFHAWSTGKRHLKGVRYDGTAMCKAGVGWRDPAARKPFGQAMTVELHPLPIDEGKSKRELVALARNTAKALIAEHDERRTLQGVGVLGADKMRAMSPYARPKQTKRGKAAPLAVGTEDEVAAFKLRHAAAGATRDEVVLRLVRNPATAEYPEGAAMPSVLRKAIRQANDQDVKTAQVLVQAGRPDEPQAVLRATPRRRPWPTLPDEVPVARGARTKKRRSRGGTRKQRRPTSRADRLRRRGRTLLRVGPKRRRRVTGRLGTAGQRPLTPREVPLPPTAAGPAATGAVIIRRVIRLQIRPAVEGSDEDAATRQRALSALSKPALT
ncbi:MAG: hypothetical protein KC613_17875 [Myxococcales bacterium]|nr:hypothetical protein [Myxococcales bacterium]